jgi:hypothetical protein
MGADLMISAIEIKHNEETALRKVDELAITEADLSNLTDIGVWRYEDEEFTPELVERIKADLRKAVKVVYHSGRRDTTRFYVDYGKTSERKFVVTGGMSHGDAPTNAWDSFCLVEAFASVME